MGANGTLRPMNGTSYDAQAVRLLDFLARNGSFRKAALAAGVPLATFCRHIELLEHSMGATLVLRMPRATKLTSLGEELLARAAPALQSLDDAFKAIRDSQAEVSGTVRLTTTPLLAEFLVAPALAPILLTYPKIRLEFNLSATVQDLRGEVIDFALRVGNVQDESLIARRIGRTRFFLYGSPNLGGVKEPPRLAFSDDPERNSASVVSTDLRVLRQLVLAGCGIAVLPEMLCQADETAGRLVRWMPNPVVEYPLNLVYPFKQYRPAAVSLIANGLAKYLEENT
jgi:DNA-binding transcriptional LysR family regulator